MRNRTASLPFLLVLISAGLALGAAQAPDPATGPEARRAPAFRLPALNGGSIDSSDLRGKVVVLDFWATWCGPCIRGLPVISQTAGQYQRQGVAFYAINVGERRDKVHQFVRVKGWRFEVLLDAKKEASRAFGVGGIPHMVVIDRHGEVFATHAGFSGAAPAQAWLKRSIEGALRR